MFRKSILIFLAVIFSIGFTGFAAETFEYNNIVYVLDLVSVEGEETETLTLTAVGYANNTSSVVPQTILASTIYKFLNYDDADSEQTDISEALSVVGEAPLTVLKASSLSEGSKSMSGGGSENEDGIFIPDSLEEISKDAAAPAKEPEKKSDEIQVVLHGIYTFTDTTVKFPDQKPVIVEGRTLVPARGVFEELGYSVDWDANTSSITVSNNKRVVNLSIGSDKMYIDGRETTLDVSAQLIGGRTMIPLRAISWGLGLEIEWEESKRTVHIYYK